MSSGSGAEAGHSASLHASVDGSCAGSIPARGYFWCCRMRANHTPYRRTAIDEVAVLLLALDIDGKCWYHRV